MITTLIALATFVLGIVLTHTLYVRKLAKIKDAHKAAMKGEFHYAFNCGWQEGCQHGKRYALIEKIDSAA